MSNFRQIKIQSISNKYGLTQISDEKSNFAKMTISPLDRAEKTVEKEKIRLPPFSPFFSAFQPFVLRVFKDWLTFYEITKFHIHSN